MYVYTLRDGPDDPALAGGKGAALGRLLRDGFPVPDGFLLTTDAFRAFLAHNALDGHIERFAATADGEAAVLERLCAAAWPDDLRSAVGAAYLELAARTGADAVCVRSSATAEDSAGASFAGQHTTFLNVHGRDHVLDAVLRCWASLYSQAAISYRRGRAAAGQDSMAVVVQELVPADASGVAFTLDPVTGDRDAVVIEGAFGLGVGVVDGIVAADRYVVSKADRSITDRRVAEKHLRIVSSGEGTTTEGVPPEDAARPSLEDGQAVELARLAADIEARDGAPQDIEWALAGGRLYLLQSRPVTAAGAAPVEDDGWFSEFDTPTAKRTLWTAANVQEVLPDHISPFSMSVFVSSWSQVGDAPIRRMGIRLKTKDPFSGFFYGRPFLNVNMSLEVVDQTPFASAEPLLKQFYGDHVDYRVEPKRLTPRRLWRYANVLPRMIVFRVRMPAEIRQAEAIVEQLEREQVERPFSERPDDELLRAVDNGIELGTQVSVTHVSGAGITSASFDGLGAFTKRWLADDSGALQATLCSGLAELESAQPAYELWDLSRLVLASPQLRQAFDAPDGVEIERRLRGLAGADADGFRRRLDEFLRRHGHRSVMEAEVAAKSWDEDLPTVLVMVRNYLHAPDSTDPRQHAERQRKERERTTAECGRRLGLWQRLLFRGLLSGAHEWVAKREYTKSLLVRASHCNRRVSRELARRLTERGLLDDAWDFYHLTLDEAKALLRGGLSRRAAYAQIDRRRSEEQRNLPVLLPQTFRGRPRPLRPSDLPLPDGHRLEGIAVSPGRVTGPARVILDPRRDGAIEPGEILVAPVTDAGWTPLFIAAAGVVVDIGSTLSHGSTVAREYGLPAVVNVKHGTRVIRTGQTITVDGTQGVVVLEDGV